MFLAAKNKTITHYSLIAILATFSQVVRSVTKPFNQQQQQQLALFA